MRILVVVLMLFISLTGYSQGNYTSTNKKAIEFFEIAIGYYNKGDLEYTKNYIEFALEKDPNFIEPYLLLADLENEQYHFKEEIAALKKVIEINPEYNSKMYFFVAKSEMKIGSYDDAVVHLNKCISFSDSDTSISNSAKEYLVKAEFGAYAIKHPVPFNPINLGPYVNTEFKDYWPSLTADENTMMFTVQLPTKYRMPNGSVLMQEDFFITHKTEDGTWSPSLNVGSPINTQDNEGAQGISADGRFLFYTACNRKEDFGSCDIYYSEKMGNRWSTPKNIGPPISTSYWESNPAPSSDGRVLFLASGGRPDSKGGRDIYFTRKNENGTWTEPVNLGDSINTKKNEYAPFIHPDGKTLYFSSDGWPGMGGQDIFYSRLKKDGTWSTPKNIGYPINTFADDFGLTVNAHGNLAMYSSNRDGSRDWDIFQFELYPEARPQVVTWVKGVVYDVITKQKLEAEVEMLELETSESVTCLKSDPITGAYLACIPTEKNYALNVAKKGYVFYSGNFSLEGLTDFSKPYNLDVPLTPIKPGVAVVLRNIFFDTDLSNLKPKSKTELSKLISFLKENPGVSIEIGGHTDNVGSQEHNLKLSQNRAKSVQTYLVEHGIASTRLSSKGYSFSKPIATNDTEEGRALNRRTEFIITTIK
ncbi:MAG: OmpA family protein [Bacteroidia bacterium]|nr:OmpA family protein [Bacteroidia bacterium]